MNTPKGIKTYKQYWEDQSTFMDVKPWAIGKIAKIILFSNYKSSIMKLGFSNHSISQKENQFILRLKVPYNYHQIDNFEEKILELLGIEQHWLINIVLEDSICKSTKW